MNKSVNIEPESIIFKEELGLFKSVGLNQIEDLKLMDRIDKKFLFPVNLLHDILPLLSNKYYVLQIENDREFRYRTLYYDTPDMSFFNQHVTGKLERYKVRLRNYVSTGGSYLEVKQKSNKGRTIKWRIKKDINGNGLDNESKTFINKYVPIVNMELHPVMASNFKRITLLGFDTGERITIDIDLSFEDVDFNRIHMPFLAIAEVKYIRGRKSSPITDLLLENRIRSTGFSKYCVGTSLLFDISKKGTMKPKLITLKRIENEYNKHIAS